MAKTQPVWQRYFKNLSQWWDNRSDFLYGVSLRTRWFASQINLSSPNVSHTVIKDSLWLDEHPSPWSKEEPNRRGLRVMRNDVQVETLHVGGSFDILGLLKACTFTKDIDKGYKIHVYIQEHKLLGENSYVGSTLVHMYAKCGALFKAQQVLEELPVRDVVSWNALIAGYVQQGQGEEALRCFIDMLHEGHSPTVVTFLGVLKACGIMGTVTKGEEIHDKIVSLGMLEKDTALGNTLVDMYVKCGTLAKAQQVLEELPVRNAVSWSALISGYVQQGQGEKALKCFNDMLHEGHSPDVVTFVCVLKACTSIGAAAKAKEIHDKIASLGMLEKDIMLGTTLVNMYAKCGALAKAQQVLDELPVRNVVSWSALIAGYVQQEQGEKAIKCFNDMLCEGHCPNAVTFICVLKACGSIGAAAKGEEIHGKIINLGLVEKDIVLANALVDMYVKCGALSKAQRVLKELPLRNVVTWNELIAGYDERGQSEEALKCFDDMLHEGLSPTAVTFIYALKACENIGAAAKGKEIHDRIVSLGILEKDIVLGTALVNMYAKCGALAKAQEVLEELPVQDVVSWNALIAGYAMLGQGKEALKCFDDMLHEGKSPNAVSFICALKACGSIGASTKGIEIHEKIVSLGVLEKDAVLGTALVNMYAKCGALAKAQQVLKELPVQDVVSWNALIAGYAMQGQGEEALNCFDDMLHEGHSPNAVSFICALKACGSIGAVAKGEKIHGKLVSLGMLEKDPMLGTTLVDMYAKCGRLSKAHQVLEELSIRDVVSWSALISGYARQGKSLEAISCFEKMQANGVKPNSITLTTLLHACSHSGLLDYAETHFLEMNVKYGIYPKLEHYCCMADLFSRVGNFDKALSMIAEMPSDKYLSSWIAFMGACRERQEVKLGELAFEHALHLDKSNTVVYVLMSDIYAAAGMQEEADKVEMMRVQIRHG